MTTWGIDGWIDDALPKKAGEEWSEEIVNAIEHSRVMVLVFSSHANASKFVKNGMLLAVNLGLPIIPFRVEDVAPQGALLLHLPAIQWLNAYPDPAEHYDTLASRVDELLSGDEPLPRDP